MGGEIDVEAKKKCEGKMRWERELEGLLNMALAIGKEAGLEAKEQRH